MFKFCDKYLYLLYKILGRYLTELERLTAGLLVAEGPGVELDLENKKYSSLKISIIIYENIFFSKKNK